MLKDCRSLYWLVVVLVGILSSASAAAGTFPERPLRLLVPFPAGGALDSMARIFAREITLASGQPVVVENKGGASGIIGAEQAARAEPDGYTILLASNTHVANKFLFKRLAYDPVTDFKAVSLYKKPSPMILAVAAAAPYRSLAELTRAAGERPGSMTFASGSASSRVAAELYQRLAGLDILHVPYKGNQEAINEVVAGRVDMTFVDVTTFVPMMKAGKLRPLVIMADEPLPVLRGVPTALQAGFPELSLSTWGVFLLPARTPDAIADRWHALIGAASKSEAMQQYLRATNSLAFDPSRAEVAAFIQAEAERWGSIIRNVGIEPQ